MVGVLEVKNRPLNQDGAADARHPQLNMFLHNTPGSEPKMTEPGC